ncbi:hypothetical protein Nmel_003665 [Mimus melanotis]|jgi:hypothetical protein
MKEE